MTNEKFASGAFVFTRARGLQPQDPDDLPPLASRHNIDPRFIPTYAGDRVAIARAITQASSGLQREGQHTSILCTSFPCTRTRVDQLEVQACYVFTMESPAVDLLFQTARDTMVLNKTRPRVARDPRIKLVQHETRKALAITANLDVLATDVVRVLRVDPEIVKKAAVAVVKTAAAVVAAAPVKKERYTGCFGPEPPAGWWRAHARSCRSDKCP